jgi:hypothetical protein
VGHGEDFTEELEFLGAHAEVLESHEAGVLAEESHDDGFAVDHGDDGDTDIDFAAFEADFDPAVLGDAFFCDIEGAEDFDTGDDGGLEAFDTGGDRDILEHAVDAVADAEFVLEGFYVDIGGAEGDGVTEDLVYEADDGGIFGGFVEVGFRILVFGEDLEAFFLFEEVECVGADAEVFFDFALEGFGGGEDGQEFQAGEGAEAIEARGSEEPATGDLDRIAFLR